MHSIISNHTTLDKVEISELLFNNKELLFSKCFLQVSFFPDTVNKQRRFVHDYVILEKLSSVLIFRKLLHLIIGVKIIS